MSSANGNGEEMRFSRRRFSCPEKLSQCTRIILLPISQSKHCERALNYYLEQLRKEEDRLHLIHIIVPETGPGISRPVDVDYSNDYPGPYVRLVEEARKLRAKYLQRLEVLGIPAEFELFLANNATSELLGLIEEGERDIKMIVLASHGYGFLRRILCRSVSAYLIHNAHLPVTVIPPPKDARRSFWHF